MIKNIKKTSFMLFFSMMVALLLQGCSDPEQDNVNKVFRDTQIMQKSVQDNYQKLSEYVSRDGDKRKYQTGLKIALETISKEMPDSEAVKDMVVQFKRDTTKDGSIWKNIEEEYKSLMSRSDASILLNTDKDKPKNQLGALTNLLNAYNNFNQANTIERFDERFIDYINTLASLSKNIEPAIIDKIDRNTAVGDAFVGNTQYGSWVKDSNGNDTWKFLETYMYLSFLNNMLFDNSHRYNYNDYRSGYNTGSYNNPRASSYRYDNWSNNRNYSYYNDTYVKTYATPSQKKSYNVQQSNLTSKYSKSLKPNTTLNKQKDTIVKSNKLQQSNLIKARTVSSTGGVNTGAGSGTSNKVQQSNLISQKTSSSNSSSYNKTKPSSFSSSNKSVKSFSKSVSVKKGK